jgi:hypothetical protein
MDADGDGFLPTNHTNFGGPSSTRPKLITANHANHANVFIAACRADLE